MNARGWSLVVALALLVTGTAAQEGGAGQLTFEQAPSLTFGQGADLGKYTYLGPLSVPREYQMPGQGSPIILDKETLQRLYQCPGGLCADYGYAPGNVVAIAPELAPPTMVASDEVRLDNPQGVELGLRLTVAGSHSVVNIKAAGTFTQKLAAGVTAVAEIASGSTVTTTSLQPGKAYTIQIVNGAYFIVPSN